MNPFTLLALWGIALVFAVLRFSLPSKGLQKSDVYKDLAHLYVGGLFGAVLASRNVHVLAIAGTLTLAEVVAFLVKRK